VVLSAACSLALAGLGLALQAAPADGQATANTVTVDKVTIGGADNKTILVQNGLIGLTATAFKVTNTGKTPHNFVICYETVNAVVANKCIAGKGTKVLKPHASQTFSITLQQGIHEYLSTVSGDAKRGMKGGLDAEPIAAPAPVDTTPAVPCPNPVTTQVAVAEDDGSLVVTPTSVPCGNVVFTITNNSQQSEHNFSILRFGETRAASPPIEPGGNSLVLTVQLGPGTHSYQSDDAIDVYQGMIGKLTVTS
jgi:hypothetical protein